jgi:hypothetical protein
MSRRDVLPASLATDFKSSRRRATPPLVSLPLFLLGRLVSCPVAAQLLHELIVDTQDEKGGCPLADEERTVVITQHLHY